MRTKSRPRHKPGAFVLFVFLLAGCAAAPSPSPTPAPVTHTIKGTFVLQQKEPVQWFALTCEGTGGYTDIRPGLGVVVKDDKSAVVGASALEGTPRQDDVASSQRCVYIFTVNDVPDAPFYSVEVGHRGAITYSRADLDAAGWKVSTKLGG